MRASTSVRGATRPLLNAARAGPSTPAPPKPRSHAKNTAYLEDGKASGTTLNGLVGLHHKAASFMRDPSEIHGAFETAFRMYQPEFRSYAQFKAGALRAHGERAPEGLETLAERNPQGAGARRGLGTDAAPSDYAQLEHDVFRAPRTWTFRRAAHGPELTERELRVKEALFGTWERGQDAIPRPGLDGVVDIVKARGTTVKDAAKEWATRDKTDKDTSTEDGM
ncbi:uncharacterized protein LOC62_03G004436 [Vanrija pseudolonga]|uniref:Uncharacterized protein n=1 Tax=Vanrija pseudolonga TaxID=143232 RepID=A0AAF1BHX3_9TREE|nr:hypothetical protein LOC62_03G004436 [Vanrija pseudolonga]